MNTYPASGPRSSTVDARENRLLGALPAVDLQRWQAHLEPVDLVAGESLTRAGESPGFVVFPTTASISLMHTTRDGDSLEILATGNEGMVGLQAVMGGGAALEGTVVRVAGQGYRVSKAWMQSEFHGCPAVMDLVLRYAQTVLTHTAQAAICNTHHSLEQRLCRCLLSTFDHGRGGPMTLTHEGLSCMLGVRREGVTGVATKLQRADVIRYTRGRVAVVDRHALEALSCECYRLVKTFYDRMLPTSTPLTSLASQPHVATRPDHAPWAASARLPGHHRAYVEGRTMAG